MSDKPMLCEGTCPVVARLTRERDEALVALDRACDTLANDLHPAAEWRSLFLSHPPEEFEKKEAKT